jgi:hypothetical protein
MAHSPTLTCPGFCVSLTDFTFGLGGFILTRTCSILLRSVFVLLVSGFILVLSGFPLAFAKDFTLSKLLKHYEERFTGEAVSRFHRQIVKTSAKHSWW